MSLCGAGWRFALSSMGFCLVAAPCGAPHEGDVAMIWEILWGFEPALITGFVIAGLILNLTPGAVFLFITSSGLSGGPRMGVAAALVVNLGSVAHIFAPVSTLLALLRASQ